MSTTNIYRQIIDPDAIEGAMKALLNDYISDYLGEMERIKGFDPNQVARPRGILTSSEFAKWDGDQLPLLLIVSPGLDGKPVKSSGEGRYDAAWSVTVAAIVSSIEQLETRRLMGAYAAAIRAAVVQHKALRSSLHPNGFADYTAWMDESYSDIPFGDTRALDSCRVVFSVGVNNVVTRSAGPREPASDPAVDPGPLPTVNDVKVTTTPVRVLA